MAKFLFFAALLLFLVLENDGARLPDLDTCGGEKCEFYSYCDTSGSKPRCECPMICTMEYNPTCGSDGIVYTNLCSLKVASCTQNKSIKVANEKECIKNDKDGDLQRSMFEDESELESVNDESFQDPELMMVNQDYEKVDVYKDNYPVEKVDEKLMEPLPTKPQNQRLILQPETARDIIQAEINRLKMYSEQLPGIELVQLPPVEYLELYSEVELAGDILCVLKQIEIVIPQIKVALDEFIARYGEEIGVYQLEDFEIKNIGSGSGDGSGSVQLGDCPAIEAPPEAGHVEMMDLEGDAMTELSYFVETLLLSEISLNASIMSKYI